MSFFSVPLRMPGQPSAGLALGWGAVASEGSQAWAAVGSRKTHPLLLRKCARLLGAPREYQAPSSSQPSYSPQEHGPRLVYLFIYL